MAKRHSTSLQAFASYFSHGRLAAARDLRIIYLVSAGNVPDSTSLRSRLTIKSVEAYMRRREAWRQEHDQTSASNGKSMVLVPSPN